MQWDSEIPGLVVIELVRRAVSRKLGRFTKSEIMELVPSIGKASVGNPLKQLTKDGENERYGRSKATFHTRNNHHYA